MANPKPRDIYDFDPNEMDQQAADIRSRFAARTRARALAHSLSNPSSAPVSQPPQASGPQYMELFILPEGASALAVSIEESPKSRSLELRSRRELKGLNKKPWYNLEAALAYTRGTQQAQSCLICARGNGPFRRCITFPEEFNGACCNCRYGGGGSGCDFHSSATGTPKKPLCTSNFAI